MARELNRLWKVETKVIPIVVVALGTVAKGLEKNLKKAGANVTVELLQKATLLNTHTTHTIILLLFWILSGTTRVSRYQKGKTRKVKPIWIYWSKRQ